MSNEIQKFQKALKEAKEILARAFGIQSKRYIQIKMRLPKGVTLIY